MPVNPAHELGMALRRTDLISSNLERYNRATPTADRAQTLACFDTLFRLEAGLLALLACVKDAIETTDEAVRQQARQAYSHKQEAA